jgi:hypothetical protein
MATMTSPFAKTRIKWRSAEEGGRQELPSGPTYAPTAHLVDDPEIFSVVFHLEQPVIRLLAGGKAHLAHLSLLAGDLLPDVVRRIVPGSKLLVMEGARIVAECEVLSLVDSATTA